MRKISGILLMICLVACAALAEPGRVDTGGGRLILRQAPEADGAVLLRIRNGDEVEVLEALDGWYHVRYDGREGFVMAQYVRLLSEAAGQAVYTNGATVYLRESPEPDARIVGMAHAQQAMTVEQIDESWVLVSFGASRGYVPTSEINRLNSEPAAAADNRWAEGTLQQAVTLYREPDEGAEIAFECAQGSGVTVCEYSEGWLLVQAADEDGCGFARQESVRLTVLPRQTEAVDDSQFIPAARARSIAEKALAQYPGFSAKRLARSQDTALSTDGIRGPMYRFHYKNKAGHTLYSAYVHAYTGEVLYTGDYSGFEYDQDIGDLHTAAPRKTQAPSFVYGANGEVLWDGPTPEPLTGTDIGEDAARSIADRYLAARYPRFSGVKFSRVRCRHAVDPTEGAGFQVPYYQFDYYVFDGTAEMLAYEIIINAYTREIEYCASTAMNEGNG